MNAENDPRGCDAPCPAPEELLDSLTGESGRTDRPDITRHLASCDSCRALIEELRSTMKELRVLDEPEGPVDLVSGILARISERAWSSPGRRKTTAWPTFVVVPLKIAAAIALLLGGTMLCWRTMQHQTIAPQLAGPARQAGVQMGLNWLADNQNQSGGWHVEELGGKKEYATALSGLATLALLRNQAEAQGSERVLRRAVGFLVRQQDENGRFGPDIDGTMYNQGIATLAMLEVYRFTQDVALRQPISNALAFICGHQTASGGWGYNTANERGANTSITAWQVQSLLSAVQQGWEENAPSLRKGLNWMTRTVDDRGFFGYERPREFPDGPGTLTMMGAYCALAARRANVNIDATVLANINRGMEVVAHKKPTDVYGTFFYTAALEEAATSQFSDVLEALRRPLLASQTTTGKDSGSWPANDRWQSAGGRLYSTSMSLLSL